LTILIPGIASRARLPGKTADHPLQIPPFPHPLPLHFHLCPKRAGTSEIPGYDSAVPDWKRSERSQTGNGVRGPGLETETCQGGAFVVKKRRRWLPSRIHRGSLQRRGNDFFPEILPE